MILFKENKKQVWIIFQVSSNKSKLYLLVLLLSSFNTTNIYQSNPHNFLYKQIKIKWQKKNNYLVKLLTILYLIILHKWKHTQSQKSHKYKMNYKFGQKWIFTQKSASLGDLQHRGAHQGMFKFPILLKFKEKLGVLLKKKYFGWKSNE